MSPIARLTPRFPGLTSERSYAVLTPWRRSVDRAIANCGGDAKSCPVAPVNQVLSPRFPVFAPAISGSSAREHCCRILPKENQHFSPFASVLIILIFSRELATLPGKRQKSRRDPASVSPDSRFSSRGEGGGANGGKIDTFERGKKIER